MSRRIFITGGTGFIGRAIIDALQGRGDKVVLLTRRARTDDEVLSQCDVVEGDPTSSGPWQDRMAGCDAVINLAGANVGDRRWTAKFKQQIHDSRIDTTRFVVEGMAALADADRPKALVSSSGIDYYPVDEDLGFDWDDDHVIGESTPPGDSYLARVCRHWETEAREAAPLGVRVTLVRTGLVLGKGGALPRMARPFKWFVGGRLGKGRQWMSWVHLDDAVRGFLACLDDPQLKGPVNLVAPHPLRNAEFSRVLGRALRRPSAIPAPAFAIRAVAGEFSEYILGGRRVMPLALGATEFEFLYPELEAALAQIYPPR